MQNNRQQGIESQDHPPHPPKKLKGEKSDFPTLIHRFNATPIQINLNSFFVVVIHRVSRLSLKVIWKGKGLCSQFQGKTSVIMQPLGSSPSENPTNYNVPRAKHAASW